VGAVVTARLLLKDGRASGLEGQGLAQLTWGRVALGLALIDSASALFDTDEAELQRQQWRLLLPVLGAGRASEQQESAARAWLADAAKSGGWAARAQWTLALDALRQGDTAIAQNLIGTLAKLGASDSAAARLAQLAAAILLSPRDPRGALNATQSLLGDDSPAPGNDIFARSLLHLSRAQWFEVIGQPADAGREALWYENSDTDRFPVMEAQKMEVDAVASVAARVTRARLLLDAGQADVACKMLLRVRELWRNADASLDAAVAQANSLHRAACS